MENLLMLLIVILICAIAVNIFCCGYFIGFIQEKYKAERKKATRVKFSDDNATKGQSEKAKKDWKNFMQYDGAAPDN